MEVVKLPKKLREVCYQIMDGGDEICLLYTSRCV